MHRQTFQLLLVPGLASLLSSLPAGAVPHLSSNASLALPPAYLRGQTPTSSARLPVSTVLSPAASFRCTTPNNRHGKAKFQGSKGEYTNSWEATVRVWGIPGGE